ncbi:MAG: hypothetical protein A2015_14080 [Spirochaetes bacterium GWF1_31_7]|nr:MAG: hypothetical protein A2Y30_03670 [Spirochaetes bacterium GWE1_32_154]OHD45235.1 MAG: hypothetical protein A2Y29_02270 [Spirochaetes bacterium GWE2_31_10]OHD50530.1 MAG: hypothetical protein A2015_14080 [Spirochaetes bacterium GWF1_31_7]OHD79143.1 MAG: hypothetical protein A2355_11000 [Spirochaetes bacterium RIFOXYB1_FULL_32_8]HBD94180.1 hypothetical protein [Spirochaetia bacterium]
MIEIICTKNAPKAIGPYSQGIKTNNTIYISGQLPYSENGSIAHNDIKKQATQCLKNIENILLASNGTKNNIVKLTIFLKNLQDFPLINEACVDFFDNGYYPARSTVEISNLPKDANIEIEGIAVLD